MQYVGIYPNVSNLIKQTLQDWGWGTTWNGIELYEYVEESGVDYIAACSLDTSITVPNSYLPGNPTSPANMRFNSVEFTLYVNTDYINAYSAADWIHIMTHELGHALGIGFWDYATNNFLPGAVNGTTAYNSAVSAYNTCAYGSNTSRTQIPLEADGADGTAGYHWEDNYRSSTVIGSGGVGHNGLRNELMVGWFSQNTTPKLSRVSLGYLKDLGYNILNPAGEGCPSISSGTSIALSSEDTNAVHLGCKKRNFPKPLIIEPNTQ
jgi:hypothetical protein